MVFSVRRVDLRIFVLKISKNVRIALRTRIMAESFKQQQNMNMKSVASPHQEREERIRALWKASDTFKKSISKFS